MAQVEHDEHTNMTQIEHSKGKTTNSNQISFILKPHTVSQKDKSGVFTSKKQLLLKLLW